MNAVNPLSHSSFSDAPDRFAPLNIARKLALRCRLILPWMEAPWGKPAKPVATVLAGVAANRGAIDEVSAVLEERFGALSGDLLRLSSTSDQLIAGGERLLELATGHAQHGAGLQQAIEFLDQPIAFLDACRTRSLEMVAKLHEYNELIVQVAQLEAVMQRALTPLRYIRTAFRIEAASLAPEVQTVFSTLTEEIGELHRRVTQAFAEQFQGLETARVAVASLVSRLGTQLRAQQEVIAQKKKGIEGSLAELKIAMEKSRNQDVRLTSTARTIQSEVNRMVANLQFQDITRQKLEHVKEAIDQLEVRGVPWDGGTRDQQRAARTEAFTFLNETSRVQACQIESVLSDLAGAEVEIRGAVQNLVEHVAALDQECLTLRGFRSISISDDGVVEVLLTARGDMCQLTASALALQTEAYETMRPLAGLMSNVTGVIRDLSASIKMVALNAQIHAAQLGAGTGLEVLSQRTCSIADEANQINATAASDLVQLISGLDQLVQECGSLRDGAEAQHRWLTSEGGNVDAQLHSYRDQTLACFVEISSQIEAFRKDAAKALENAEFHANAVAVIEPLVESLRELAAGTRDHAKAAATRTGAELNEHLQKSYTMESERAAHRAALGIDAPATGEAAVSQSSDIECFESFEAFESFDTPAKDAPVRGSNSEATLQPAVPESTSPVSKAVVSSPAEDSLGDNIELF